MKNYTYKKTVRTISSDGKTVEEAVETSTGSDAKERADEAFKEADERFKKMDRFFAKMDEAFKEL